MDILNYKVYVRINCICAQLSCPFEPFTRRLLPVVVCDALLPVVVCDALRTTARHGMLASYGTHV